MMEQMTISELWYMTFPLLLLVYVVSGFLVVMWVKLNRDIGELNEKLQALEEGGTDAPSHGG